MRRGDRIERQCRECWLARLARYQQSHAEQLSRQRAAAYARRQAAIADVPMCSCGRAKVMPSTYRPSSGFGVCSKCRTESRPKAKQTPAARRATRLRQKAAAAGALGGACECCGENLLALLTVDHRNDDGGGRIRPAGAWVEARRSGYDRDRFALMCWNCNVGRHINGGVCPHQE